MTKKQLIEILEKYPDDIEIFVDKTTDRDMDFEDNKWASEIREIFVQAKMVKNGKIANRACKETAGAKKAIIF